MVTDYDGKFEFDQGVEKLFSLQNGRRYRLKTNEAFFLDKLCNSECKNFKIIFFFSKFRYVVQRPLVLRQVVQRPLAWLSQLVQC